MSLSHITSTCFTSVPLIQLTLANCNYSICNPWSAISSQITLDKMPSLEQQNRKHINSVGELALSIAPSCSNATTKIENAKNQAFIIIYLFKPLIHSQIEHRFSFTIWPKIGNRIANNNRIFVCFFRYRQCRFVLTFHWFISLVNPLGKYWASETELSHFIESLLW